MATYKRANTNLWPHSSQFQSVSPESLERWAALYNLIRTIPDDKRFNMAYWGRRDKTLCGTSACAAGHATLHPWFRERGLRFTAMWGGEGFDFNQPEFFGIFSWYGSPFDPDYSTFVGGKRRLTPVLVSEVLMAWMLSNWNDPDVGAAVEATKHVKYDIEAVHKYTPWKGVPLGKKPTEGI